jgi:hypothetical protein
MAARRFVSIRTALLAVVAVVAVALTLPAGASAAPTAGDRQKARGSCANERGLSKAKHQRFNLKYGARNTRRAFSRCVRIKARMYAARRRNNAGLGLPGVPAVPGVPALPGVPGVPTLPGGIPEMPGVRMECQVKQMEDPIAFAQEFPGGLEMCVLMESMP